MNRRPQLNGLYATVSDFTKKGSVKYMAHLIDRNGVAYEIGSETSGTGGTPSNHPDQQYWQGKSSKLRNALTSANASISRIEIDCTLLPCDGKYNGCLYRVPYLIRELLTGLKTEKGKGRFTLLDTIDPDKIPLRIFSHKPENEPSKVIFCLVGDSQQQLEAAYDSRDGWVWVPYRDEYLGPNVANGNRQFQVAPSLA
jgi:hypothetical protein